MKNNQPKDNQFDFLKETSLIAFLDLTNMFHWQDTLKWNFSIYQVYRAVIRREIR